jgi:flagellar biosynthetic protein FliQ
MDVEQVVELGRQAILVTLIISAPVLLAGMLVGLAVGLVQALTQIQEQTVAFVPKIVAMVVALTFTLPWLVNRMLEYSHDLIAAIPDTL